MKFQFLLVAVLALYGCASYVEIADVNAVEGIAVSELHERLGNPSGYAGSGINYQIYRVSKTKEVWIAIVEGKAMWAYLKEKGQSDVVLFGKQCT